MLLFRKYGLCPDFVALGKGFPGGEYPASRIITTAEYDNLNQFGALVTNGQEELASLSYLVTMSFARANSDEVERLGSKFFDGLLSLKDKYPAKVIAVEGLGHLAALHFNTVGRRRDLQMRSMQTASTPAHSSTSPTVYRPCSLSRR